MKQKRRQKMWQEFKVLILASVGLKRHKKGSKEIKRYDGYKIYIVLLITYLRISKKNGLIILNFHGLFCIHFFEKLIFFLKKFDRETFPCLRKMPEN